MTIDNRNKLKKIMRDWQPETIATYPWLKPRGISHQLVAHYVKSGWLTKIAPGAFIKTNEPLSWAGVVHTLQAQLNLPIHIGGLSAIELRGYRHYVRNIQLIDLYGPPHLKLPAWFKKINLENINLSYLSTHLFTDPQLGVSQFKVEKFTLICASLERAIIEMLAFVPQKYSYDEATHLMESLKSLRPIVVQNLLEQCHSIKAKRLFLHLATKCQHSWLKQFDLSKIRLGSGIRKIPGGDHFDKEYSIYVPSEPLNEGHTSNDQLFRDLL